MENKAPSPQAISLAQGSTIGIISADKEPPELEQLSKQLADIEASLLPWRDNLPNMYARLFGAEPPQAEDNDRPDPVLFADAALPCLRMQATAIHEHIQQMFNGLERLSRLI